MLTERQKALYEFLLKQNYFMYEDEIALYSGVYAQQVNWQKPFHDSPVRHEITKDIRAINESYEVNKIIISTPQGIKIATEEEFKQYIDAEFAAIFRKLKRTYAKAKKANLDGQYNFKDQVIEVFN